MQFITVRLLNMPHYIKAQKEKLFSPEKMAWNLKAVYQLTNIS
jgi:hypothetical protein